MKLEGIYYINWISFVHADTQTDRQTDKNLDDVAKTSLSANLKKIASRQKRRRGQTKRVKKVGVKKIHRSSPSFFVLEKEGA